MIFDKDIDLLCCFLECWWANRSLHQDMDRVDIQNVRDRLLQRSQQESTIWEYAVALREELWNLGDGHLQIRSMFDDSECAFTSGLGFLAVAEGVALAWIDTVDRQIASPAMQPGDLLLEADRRPIEAWLQSVRLRPGSTPAHRRWNAVLSLSYQERFPGEEPAPSVLTFEKKDGTRYSINIEWKSAPKYQLGPNCVRGSVLRQGVGYVEIRSFYCMDEFGQVSDAEFRRQTLHTAEKIRGIDDLIIDLRGNSGGRDQQAQIAAGLCTRGPMEWFRYRHRGRPGDPNLKPPRIEQADTDGWWPAESARPAPRSLWFLIGPGCFSTGEVFASAFRNRGGAVFVGQPTAGGAGNPIEFRLPYSGFAVTIPVSEIYMAGTDNLTIETNGIKPDIPVVQTAMALQAGRDAVLEKTLDAIQQRKSVYA